MGDPRMNLTPAQRRRQDSSQPVTGRSSDIRTTSGSMAFGRTVQLPGDGSVADPEDGAAEDDDARVAKPRAPVLAGAGVDGILQGDGGDLRRRDRTPLMIMIMAKIWWMVVWRDVPYPTVLSVTTT